MMTTFPPLATSGGYMPDDAGDGLAFADMLRPLLADVLPDGELPAGPDIDAEQADVDEPRNEADMLSIPSAEVDLAEVSKGGPAPRPETRGRENSEDDALPEEAGSVGEGRPLIVLSDETVRQNEEAGAVALREGNTLSNKNNPNFSGAQTDRADSIMPPVVAAPLAEPLQEKDSVKGQVLTRSDESQALRLNHASLRLVRTDAEAVLSDSATVQKNAADSVSEKPPAIPPRPTAGDNFVSYNGPLLSHLGFDLREIGLPASSSPDDRVIAHPGAEESRTMFGSSELALAPDMTGPSKVGAPLSEPKATDRAAPRIGDVRAVDHGEREPFARPDQVSGSMAKTSGPVDAPLPPVVTNRAMPVSADIPLRANVIALRPAAAEVTTELMPAEQPVGSPASAAPHQKTGSPTALIAQTDVIDPDQDINIRMVSVQSDLSSDSQDESITGAPDRPAASLSVMYDGAAIERLDDWFSGMGEAAKTPAQTDSPSQQSRPNHAHGPGVTHQIAAKLADLGPGRHVVQLNPEELGTVTFRITHDDAGVTILIAAERPEIMQMMRRHMDIMMADLAESGLADARMEFDDRGHHRAHDERHDGSQTVPVARADSEQALPAPLAGGVLNIRM